MYNKTNWKTGDSISELKLNHIESGLKTIGLQCLKVIANNGILNHTYNEIKDWIDSGKIVYSMLYIENGDDKYYEVEQSDCSYEETGGTYFILLGGNSYITQNPNDYPVW
jgi:hypothetical protein